MNLGKAIAPIMAVFIASLAAPTFIASEAWGQASQHQAYSTNNTTSGELLANPATRAVLEKHFPGVSKDFRIKMVKGKTFRALHDMAPERLPTAKLDAVDRDLANVQKAVR